MKNIASLPIIILLLFLAFVTSSCKDEDVEQQICPAGPGGEVELSFFVLHHDSLIPDAMIYLKYDVKDFPGSNPTDYDFTLQAGSTGQEKGHARLSNMTCGKYYVYSEGYDPDLNDTLVSGGRPFEVTQREGIFTVNVYVVE